MTTTDLSDFRAQLISDLLPIVTSDHLAWRAAREKRDDYVPSPPDLPDPAPAIAELALAIVDQVIAGLSDRAASDAAASPPIPGESIEDPPTNLWGKR